VIGSSCLAILLAVLLARPDPSGVSTTEAERRSAENLISARLPEPRADVVGASSKQPDSTTTSAPESTAVASPTPSIAGPGATAGPGSLRLSDLVQARGKVHEVSNPDQWNTALAAAKPGDQIKLVATIYQTLEYRGEGNEPGKRNAADGTPSAPITITAANGVWIDPGNKSNNKPALDIMRAANVNVVGLRVRNSQFGIRILQSSGTTETPIIVAFNTVSDIGHAGIHIGGFDSHIPSRYVRVEGNTVTRTGQTAAQYGEGIYLGYGGREWIDETSNVQVIGNEISYTTAEGIDIKPGVRHVMVENNQIHDLSPMLGGAISASYVGTAPNPKPGESIDVVLRRNRIWNVNLDGRGGSNDWAIWVGHGGVTVENNFVWGMRGDSGQTRAVRVRSPYDFGSFPIGIVNNIFWTAAGWVAEGSPSGAGLVRASGNKGPAGRPGIEVPISQAGGVPALGGGGAADSGGGPGSALGF
jgi:Right handed beta helix region